MHADDHRPGNDGPSDVPHDEDVASRDGPSGASDGLRDVASTDPPGVETDEAYGASSPRPADRMRTKATDTGEHEPETDIWSGRTSWKHFAGRIILWVLANVAVAVLLGMLASTIESFTGGHVFLIVLVLVLLSGAWVIGRIAMGILGCHYR